MFLELIDRSDNAFNCYNQEAILKNADIKRIMNEYIGDDTSAHEKLINFLKSRYRYNVTNDEMSSRYVDDIPKVKEILTYYDNKCKNLKYKFDEKLIIYKDIKNSYKQLIKYIDDEMKKM